MPRHGATSFVGAFHFVSFYPSPLLSLVLWIPLVWLNESLWLLKSVLLVDTQLRLRAITWRRISYPPPKTNHWQFFPTGTYLSARNFPSSVLSGLY